MLEIFTPQMRYGNKDSAGYVVPGPDPVTTVHASPGEVKEAKNGSDVLMILPPSAKVRIQT